MLKNKALEFIEKEIESARKNMELDLEHEMHNSSLTHMEKLANNYHYVLTSLTELLFQSEVITTLEYLSLKHRILDLDTWYRRNYTKYFTNIKGE